MLPRLAFQKHSSKLEEALTQFLRENWDIFAWKPADMLGVPRGLAEHRLRVEKRNQLKNIFDGPPFRRKKPLARRWLDSLQQSSSERYTTPSGSPMSSWFPRRTTHFACALISNISIGPAQKIIFLSLASTKLSTRLRDVSDFLSWTLIPGTIRSVCLDPMRSKRLSSPHSGASAISPCHSASRMPGPHSCE